MSEDLAQLALRTQAVYERQARRFDAERSKHLHERIWLDRFTGPLAPGARILDLGCGAGAPIAAHLMAQGFRLTGLDASSAMLVLARQRWPDGDWRMGDMRRLDLPERFDGIIGWNSFFHLTRAEQRATLPRLAHHLAPSGVLLLTVGPEEGEVSGHVGDEPVYHASLSPAAYRGLLADHGLTVTHFAAEDPDCGNQTVLVARKRGDAPA